MNTTGCPDGWATDTILYYANKPLACDMPTGAWIAISTINIAMKMSAVAMYLVLREIKYRSLQKAKKKVKRRVSIPLLTISADLLTKSLFLILSGVFAANPSNGLSSLFYGLAAGFFCATLLAILNKYVRFGIRVSPWTKVLLSNSENATLAKKDRVSNLLIGLAIFTLIGQTTVFCILGLVFPGSYIYIKAGNGLIGAFLILAGGLVIHHMDRVISVMKRARELNRLAHAENENQEYDTYQKGVWTLRAQQSVIAFLVTAGVVFLAAIAADLLSARYYIIIILFFLADFASLTLLASNFKCCQKRGSKLVNAPSLRFSKSNTKPSKPSSRSSGLGQVVVHSQTTTTA